MNKISTHLLQEFWHDRPKNPAVFGAFTKNTYIVCQRPAINGRDSANAHTSSLCTPLVAAASVCGVVVICFIIGTVWCFKKRNSDSEIVENNEMYGNQEDYYEDENIKVTDNNQLYGDKEYADECDFD